MTAREGFTYNCIARIFQTRLTTETFTLVFTFHSTLTRYLTGCIFALKALQILLVTTVIYFLYLSLTLHTFTRLTAEPWTRVTTVQNPFAAFLAFSCGWVVLAKHFKGVFSGTIESLHHYRPARILVLAAFFRAFTRTPMTAGQLSRTWI